MSGGQSDFTTSLGFGSYNWSGGSWNWANPFDDDKVVNNVSELLGWTAAVSDYYKLDYYLWTSAEE